MLKRISDVAAAAHAPFIAAAAPGLFGLEQFADFDQVHDIGRIFAAVDSVPWEAFRKSDNARYVGLTVPRVLLRLPYGRETVPIEEFAFEEGVEPRVGRPPALVSSHGYLPRPRRFVCEMVLACRDPRDRGWRASTGCPRRSSADLV